MRGINKKIISLFLAFAIVLTTFGLSSNTSYAASIKLNKTNITLLRKQTSQLKVKNTKKKVTWYSSNKSVATVSKTGKVTGQKKGTAVITAKVGSKKYRCKVKVSKQYSKTNIKKYLNKNSPLITKLAHEKHGGITQKVTIFSAKKAESGNTDAYIPVKMNDPRLSDVTKYGGVTTIAVAGYTLLEYKAGGKTVRSLEALPIYLGGSKNLTEEQMVEYFSNVLQQENKKKVVSDVNIRKKMIPMGALIKYNGFYYYLGGKTNADMYIRDAVQVCFAPKDMEYIKKVDKAVSNNDYSEKDNGVGTTVLTKEKNVSLYKNICEKYVSTIFKKKKGTIKTIVQKGKEIFEHDLTIEEQCIVLRNLMLNFKTGDSICSREVHQLEQ